MISQGINKRDLGFRMQKRGESRHAGGSSGGEVLARAALGEPKHQKEQVLVGPNGNLGFEIGRH